MKLAKSFENWAQPHFLHVVPVGEREIIRSSYINASDYDY